MDRALEGKYIPASTAKKVMNTPSRSSGGSTTTAIHGVYYKIHHESQGCRQEIAAAIRQ